MSVVKVAPPETAARLKDFTPSGVKIDGAYENDRNADSKDLFKAIIREAYGVEDVIIGHHLIYEARDKREDGYTYEIVEEIPSADALIFDHKVAAKIWGPGFKDVLVKLALEPVETRDALLAELYNARKLVRSPVPMASTWMMLKASARTSSTRLVGQRKVNRH